MPPGRINVEPYIHLRNEYFESTKSEDEKTRITARSPSFLGSVFSPCVPFHSELSQTPGINFFRSRIWTSANAPNHPNQETKRTR